jgi:hypothetical protein
MTRRDNPNLFTELGTKGLERLDTLGELNLKAWERLASRQVDVLNLMVEQGVRQMKLATEAYGYTELAKGQVELVREASERAMREARANLRLAGEVREDYRAWVEDGISEITRQMPGAGTSA